MDVDIGAPERAPALYELLNDASGVWFLKGDARVARGLGEGTPTALIRDVLDFIKLAI